MARVNRLIALGQRLKQTPSDRSDDLADLYRSAIVFLHASFEDMLRTTIEIRGAHSAKQTYGKIEVVVAALRKLNLDPTSFRPLFPELSALMDRRHRIVHEADLATPNAVTDNPWTIGDDYQLIIWVFVVTAFASRLRVALDPSEIVDEWFAEHRIGIIGELTKARRRLAAAGPIEEKKAALQAMADIVGAILAFLKRPRAEIVRDIAHKYGIGPP